MKSAAYDGYYWSGIIEDEAHYKMRETSRTPADWRYWWNITHTLSFLFFVAFLTVKVLPSTLPTTSSSSSGPALMSTVGREVVCLARRPIWGQDFMIRRSLFDTWGTCLRPDIRYVQLHISPEGKVESNRWLLIHSEFRFGWYLIQGRGDASWTSVLSSYKCSRSFLSKN